MSTKPLTAMRLRADSMVASVTRPAACLTSRSRGTIIVPIIVPLTPALARIRRPRIRTRRTRRAGARATRHAWARVIGRWRFVAVLHSEASVRPTRARVRRCVRGGELACKAVAPLIGPGIQQRQCRSCPSRPWAGRRKSTNKNSRHALTFRSSRLGARRSWRAPHGSAVR